ncbi:DEVIL-like protein [Trema orientale]|uniref:DEVIL-like protein n=1 Tax=Trema orientale TaxID=63057 RepID=A0A2P5DYB3_TREOI|nr:DEVIL-like protein [Trema orientale]
MDVVIQHCNRVKTSPSKKGHGFSRKCASLVKEQRARIYILRRCATMLLCWYIQGDD